MSRHQFAQNLQSGVVANLLVLATGTQLGQYPFTVVGTCTATNGAVCLPVNPVAGQEMVIRNDGVANCLVFPGESGDIINGNAAGACVYIAPTASLTFFPSSKSQWYTSNYSGPKPVRAIAAAATLTREDSDQVFTLSGTTYTVTLPLVANAAGCEFDFRFSAAVTAVTIAAGATVIRGNGSSADAVHSTIADASNVICTTMAIGDSLNLKCDGSKYYLNFLNKVTANITSS